jgi:hypothetical protein
MSERRDRLFFPGQEGRPAIEAPSCPFFFALSLENVMKRFHFGLMAATCSFLALSLLLTGCGKKKGDEDEDEELPRKSKTTSTGGGPKASNKEPVKATEYGTITGRVSWVGDKPNMEALTTQLREAIAKKADDSKYCLMGTDVETTEQAYRIGDNNGLGNVFVWIEPASSNQYFAIPADQLAKYKDSVVRIHQPHCAFIPHASVLFPSYINNGKEEPTGQKLEVKNDATITHNSKVGGSKNQVIDITLSPGSDKEFTLKPEKGPITVSCGVHGWMTAYIRAFDHPYAAVTSVGAEPAKKQYEDKKSPKFGTFTITGVPVGAKVKIIAWHEDLGYLEGNQGRELTLQKENTANFEAKKK